MTHPTLTLRLDALSLMVQALKAYYSAQTESEAVRAWRRIQELRKIPVDSNGE